MNKDLNELGSGINIFNSPIKKKESKIVQLHCLGFQMKELIRKIYLRLQVDRNTPISLSPILFDITTLILAGMDCLMVPLYHS